VKHGQAVDQVLSRRDSVGPLGIRALYDLVFHGGHRAHFSAAAARGKLFVGMGS